MPRNAAGLIAIQKVVRAPQLATGGFSSSVGYGERRAKLKKRLGPVEQHEHVNGV